MRHFILIALIACASFAAPPALAVLPPKSEEELLAQSDVVALVRVLSVTCTAEWMGGEMLRGYAARETAANNNRAASIDAMHLKNRLRDIQSNRYDRFHGSLQLSTSSKLAATWRAVHSINS